MLGDHVIDMFDLIGKRTGGNLSKDTHYYNEAPKYVIISLRYEQSTPPLLLFSSFQKKLHYGAHQEQRDYPKAENN